MNLLNVGCGGHRPGPPWTNLDTLREFLREGTPERTNLDAELNYVECNVLIDRIPFPVEHFDGILIQHVLEHFTCEEAAEVLRLCRFVLKTRGVLVASVPDVHYFRLKHHEDTRENSVRLFGESISGDWHDGQCTSFFEYALWHREHKQILNEDGLWALLRRAGFAHKDIWRYFTKPTQSMAFDEIDQQLNRLKFSAILYAFK